MLKNTKPVPETYFQQTQLLTWYKTVPRLTFKKISFVYLFFGGGGLLAKQTLKGELPLVFFNIFQPGSQNETKQINP